jgi:hypothetical protein
MVKEFVGLMNDLGTLQNDHPSYRAFVKAQEALKAPVSESEDQGKWKNYFAGAGYKLEEIKPDPHYTLFQNLGSMTKREVKSRRDCLEETYQIFFYWFALKGIADVNLPKERLVAVLEAESADFKKMWTQFEPTPLVTDGFYSRDHNLLVFSKDSQDALRRGLVDATYDPVGKNEDSLLHGATIDQKLPPESQTLALLLRALERDSELCSTSNGVTRQLLQATGMLPRGLTAPEWIQSGMASFFEVPRGSPWPVCVGANSLYLPQFQVWLGNNYLADPLTELKSVICDRTFRQAEAARDGAGHFKARTMAWALTYYLAERYPNELRGYFDELANLPRELELDEATLLRTFARALKLMDKKNPNEVSETALAAFAKSWFSTMRGVKLEGDDLVRTMHKYESDANLQIFKGSGSGSKK